MSFSFVDAYRLPWQEAKAFANSVVLITGGAGFIGSNLAIVLSNAGAKVKVLDDLSTGKRENLNAAKDVEFILGDIRNYETCLKAANGVDYIVHLAACASVPKSIDEPLYAHETNTTGTLNVLLAASTNKVKRCVLASSCAVYGNTQTEKQSEDMLPQPLSPYASHKLLLENYAKNFAELFGLQTVALRFFNVFGPQQSPESDYAAVIPKFISLMLSGKPPTIFGDGNQTRDFIFVGDLIRIILAALISNKVGYGEVINAGSGKNITINQLALTLKRLTGINAEPVYAKARAGDVRHSRADTKRLVQLLKFKPLFGFDKGLEITVEWFKSVME